MFESRLSRALDDCLGRLRNGATVEECLKLYPSLRKRLEPLLLTAGRVWFADRGSMPAERRTLGKAWLMGAIRSEQAKRVVRHAGGRWGKVVLAPVALAALGLALFFGLRGTQAPSIAEASSVLTLLQGEVSVDTGHGVMAAFDGMRLQEGDHVTTAQDSRAVITFSDGSTMTLESDTEVALDSITGQNNRAQVVVSQTKGNIWTYVPGGSKASQVDIQTPHAKVRASKGAFSTAVDSSGRTVIGAQAGSVELTSGGQRTSLASGSTAAVDPEGVVTQTAAPGGARQLVIRVSGPAYAYLIDPTRARVGLLGPGLSVNQVPGASIDSSGTLLTLRLPDPADGSYRIGLRAYTGGTISISASIPDGSGDSAAVDLSSGDAAMLNLSVQSGQLALTAPTITPVPLATSTVTGVEKATVTPSTVEQGTPSPTPATATPARTATPNRTPAVTPSATSTNGPAPTATPQPALTVTIESN